MSREEVFKAAGPTSGSSMRVNQHQLWTRCHNVPHTFYWTMNGTGRFTPAGRLGSRPGGATLVVWMIA